MTPAPEQIAPPAVSVTPPQGPSLLRQLVLSVTVAVVTSLVMEKFFRRNR